MIAGRYSLEREIGRGGTGTVWLGQDHRLDRPVALKRIGRVPGDDTTHLERAEREARLSARLNHPNVVAVFNVVDDPDTDARWLVMEYVDGPNLAHLVRDRGPLSADEAAPLLRQAADALAAAHAVGIMHRDVKPSNLLVGRDGKLKLTDFGIARVAMDPSLTQTGLVTGSPSYLAPEVAAGSRGDASADIWALGATVFHVMSGRPPYDGGEHALATLYRIVHDDPPKLPDAGWLAPLLAATMTKDPADRWSAAQVRDFLARGPGRSVAAVPITTTPATDHTTATLTVPGPDAAPEADPEPPAEAPVETPVDGERGGWRARIGWIAAAVVLLVGMAAAGILLVRGHGHGHPPASSDGASTSSTVPTPTSTPTPAKPTKAGMEAFIRRYVATVAADPDRSWRMLTPQFQRASGGLQTYRAFWARATAGRVLDINADPGSMSVSYHVHFDNFDNGPGPTVLTLVFQHGRYLIGAEHTKGFVPAT